MDPSQFDRLTRVLSTRASRRAAFGFLLGGVLGHLLAPLGQAGHKDRDKRKTDRRREKNRDRDKDERRQAGGTGERHGRDPEAKARAKRRPTDLPRNAVSCCSGENCAPGPKKSLKRCCYEGRNLSGANFNQSNLANASFAGATLRNANFNGANLSKVCFVDANLTGANVNGANTADAIYCRTTMPNGSTNNSGCANGTSCCPTCDARHPCGNGKVCCDGRCWSGNCCTNTECGPAGNRCANHVCKCGSGVTCAAPTPLCCGTGTDGRCQACCTNDQCPAARPFCHNGQCAGCRDEQDCTQPDELCREAVCAADGTCQIRDKSNGTGCDDGDACTRTDTCQGGLCVGGNPVVCPTPDQCHEPGVCDPQTGTCSNPRKPDGTGCDDGNRCTTRDTCQNGQCVGGDPVVCPEPDQCHRAGECDPATGACSNPARPDGSACDDGDRCTVNDTCQGGVCTSGAAVTCPASDQCHDPGVCDPDTGNCSNPAKPEGSACVYDGEVPQCKTAVCGGGNNAGQCVLVAKTDGTTCDDGDACTQTDTCQNGQCVGADQINCPDPDQCHERGECDPITGTCSTPRKPNGTPCDDGDACTRSDTCQAGACVGGDPVVCTPSDQCHDAGGCNPQTGECSNPAKPNGSPCDNGNACNVGDACQDGTCQGGAKVICPEPDQCHDPGTCDPSTGVCSNPAKPEGTACVYDGDVPPCRTAICGGGSDAGRCILVDQADGTVCDDGDACTRTDTCQGGQCVGADSVICLDPDQCHEPGVCDPATGECSSPAKPDGAACDDEDLCTLADTCQAGVCTGSDPVVCPDPDACHLPGTCDPSTGVCSNPVGPDGPNAGCPGAGCCNGVCCTGAQDACIEQQCVCQPKTCADFPNACGAISDGCSQTLQCACADGCCDVPAGAERGTCAAGDDVAACGPDGDICLACPTPLHAVATCVDRACGWECEAGWGNCDAADGCEADLSSPAHCGTCDNVCTAPADAAATCANGQCGWACNTGYHECNGVCVANNGSCLGPGGCLLPDPNHPDKTSGLQTAFDNAAAGDTITLCPGTFIIVNLPPNPPPTVSKHLTLLGAGASGANATILAIQGGGRVLRTGSPGVTPAVTMRDLTITRSGSNGGGIENHGTLTLERVRITGSRVSGGNGGGFANRPNAIATLIDCEVADNTTSDAGGGLANGTAATLTLQGTSVTGNTATAGNGGGIVSFGPATLGPSTSGPTRVTGNQSGASGDGIFSNTGGAVTLEPDTIVCGNGAAGDTQCDAGFGGTISGACPNPTDGVCCGAGFVECGGFCVDLQTDPNHCGNCATRCPTSAPTCQGGGCTCPGNGGPACGAGLTCCDNGCTGLNSDPANCGSCGNTCTGATPVCNGSGTCACGDVCPSGCRFATIGSAIAALPAGSTIRLCAGTFAERITINKNNLTLIGAGAGTGGTVVDGTGLGGRVVTVNSGVAATLQDLTVTGGQATTGGGISNNGTLMLLGVAVAGNRATTFGGGIHSDGMLTLADGTSVMNNTAGSAGAGIRNGSGTMTLQAGSSVTDNTSQGDGGGISNAFDGVVSLTLESGSRVAGNTASLAGGGILLSTMTTATLQAGSVVEDNTAAQGGGIGNRGTLFVAGEIRNNRASQGGGLYNVNSGGPATATLEAGSRVTGNIATGSGGGIYEASGTVTVADAGIVTGNTPNNCRPTGTVPSCVD